MTSGYGLQGGRSRCYGFWQDYFDCYVQADHPKECTLRLDNYMECLHHRKEKARVNRVREEWVKQQKAGKLLAGALPETEPKIVATRLGFIDASVEKRKEGK